MNNILSNVVTFAAGVGIGAVVTWKIVSNKYEQILKEEIQSVKEKFAKRQPVIKQEQPEENKNDSEKEDIDPDEVAEYESIVKSNYVNYASKKEGSEQMSFERPHVIPPSEFGECEYETVSLTYYADGVLTDDTNNIVTDVDIVVGADFASHFGEYEEDSVYVRNDDRSTDYEILLDAGKYSDLHQKEGK